jgi:gliding motility-associated lipoprotein GldH
MIRGRVKLPAIAFLLLSLILNSCNRDILFTDTVSMPERYWSLSQIPAFKFPVTDTASTCNVAFTIRTGSDYPFRNIFLFVSTISPHGNSLTDTLEFLLADERGNWYGKGFGDVHELTLPYKNSVFFPEKGTYQIKIQHGMRAGDLKGVYDFGLRIMKSTK